MCTDVAGVLRFELLGQWVVFSKFSHALLMGMFVGLWFLRCAAGREADEDEQLTGP